MNEAKDLIKELKLGETGEKLIIKKGSDFSVDEKKWSRAKEQAYQQGKEAIEKFERLQKLRQKHTEISKAQRLKAGKKGSLSVGAEVSQAIESGIHRGAIKSIQKGSLGGKDDTLTAHLFYTPPDFNLSQTPEVTDEATRLVDEAMAKISDITDGGSMNTKNLKERLKKQEAIYRELEKKLEELREKTGLDKDALNIFMEHGTTKEYTFLNNSLGFKAGALGENHEAISAINNIQLMAHKGGISFADKEWLIFAVTNCARHLIGAEINIQSSLENYLSLIAGALMFEDSDKIMLEVNKKIQTRAPETVEHIHLYRLNSFFFPLSFILYKTWENLSVLENFLEDAKHSGNQVHIDNSASWSFFEDGVFKETWVKEGKYSIDSTTITMTFMAGFLDVIENLKITSP